MRVVSVVEGAGEGSAFDGGDPEVGGSGVVDDVEILRGGSYGNGSGVLGSHEISDFDFGPRGVFEGVIFNGGEEGFDDEIYSFSEFSHTGSSHDFEFVSFLFFL